MTAILAPLPWHSGAFQRIQQGLAQGSLAHAHLFAGPSGAGKRWFAAAVAASLLCKTPDANGYGCGQCSSCKMLHSGGHPDAHLLCLDGHIGLCNSPNLQNENGLTFLAPKSGSVRKDISVDPVRSVISKLSFSTHSGGRRVIVITPAHELNESSANALLKTIEEPPTDTFIFLLAEFSQAIKQTIRSRCQLHTFAAPTRGEALTWLWKTHPQLDVELLDEARGLPLRVVDWLASGEHAHRQRWQGLLTRPLNGDAECLVVAGELAKEKGAVSRFLQYWQEVLYSQLRAQPQSWSSSQEAFLAELIEAAKALDYYNANAQLLLESLFLRWRRLSSKAQLS